MSNLASLAANFTSLNTQKNSITNALTELETLKSSNIVAQLSFVVSSVNGNATDIVNLSVTPSEANISLAKLKNLAVGKNTELQLTTKEVVVGVSCTVTSTEEGAASVEYSADFDVKDVDDNGSLSTELELLSSDSQTLKVHVKATYDTVAGLVASKQVELQEIEVAIAEVMEAIKKLKNKPAPKKEKKSKKGGESTSRPVEETSAAFDVDEEETSVFTSAVAGATEVAMTGVQMGMAHRALLLFGVAAWAISSMGEYASV